MNSRRIFLLVISFFLGSAQYLAAADEVPPALAAKTEPRKPGFQVMVKIDFDDQGVGKGAVVVESDDPTLDTILNRIALTLAEEVKQPPRQKDGKPVPFSVVVPFNFPVEGDQGEESNNTPRPRPKNPGQRPVYPENLAAAGEVGGAILELTIGANGKVTEVIVMDASHPEFAQSAEAAVRTWEFSPATENGKPIVTHWRTSIAYSVGGKDVDWKWRVAPRPSLGGSTVLYRPRTATPPAADAPATPAPQAQPAPAVPEKK